MQRLFPLLFALAALAWAPLAHAGFGTQRVLNFASTTANQSTVSITVPVGASLQAGDLVIGEVFVTSTSATPSSCSDNAPGSTNVYAFGTILRGNAGSTGSSRMVYSILNTPIPDGGIITCDVGVTGTQTKQLYLFGISGVAAFDVEAVGQFTLSNATLTLSIPARANARELIFVSTRSANTISADPACFASIGTLPTNLLGTVCITSSSSSPSTASWTQSAAGTQFVHGMAFTEASAPAAGTKSLMLLGVGQ